MAPQIQRAIERGLAAHGGQNGVGPLFGNYFFNRLPSDGLDVGHIGCGRVGHDRGRVTVDQNNLVAFFTQRFAGLHTRVVKLAGLPNDDGAGTDDED